MAESLSSSIVEVLEGIQNAILVAVMQGFDGFFSLVWAEGDPMVFAGIAVLLFLLLFS